MLSPLKVLHFHRNLMHFSNNRKWNNVKCCLVRYHLFWNSCIRISHGNKCFLPLRFCISTEFWCISQTIENGTMPNIVWQDSTCFEIHASDFSWKQMFSPFKVLHFHRIMMHFSNNRKWNYAKHSLVRNHLFWNSCIRFLMETNVFSL